MTVESEPVCARSRRRCTSRRACSTPLPRVHQLSSLLLLRSQLIALFRRHSELSVRELLDFLESNDAIEEPFTQDEARAILATMDGAGQLMLREDMICAG